MRIDITPSFCRVSGTNEELLWLRDLLSFSVPGAKYSKLYRMKRWDGKKKFFLTSSKTFPVGLLSYVQKKGTNQKFEIVDHREFPDIDQTIPTLNTIELRDYQKEAIKKCFEYKNCIVEMATNSGKTAVFSAIAKMMYPHPTLVLTHRDELLKQTVQYIERYTGLPVGFITSKDVLIRPITVAMVKTLTNRVGADQEITDFYESAECIICDESHHMKSASHTTLLMASKALFRFGFSGTIPPEDTFDGILVRQFIGSVVFNISNDQLIQAQVSAKPKVYFYEMDITPKLTSVYDLSRQIVSANKENFTQEDVLKEVYKQSVRLGITENEERNGKVLDIIRNNPGKSVLIVVDFIEHGNLVYQLLKDNNIRSSFIHGSSEVRTESLEDFRNGGLKVLISTNIIDEGLDINRIEVLILLAGKKSRRQLLQRVGRALRRKEGENVVSIYDFLDYGSSTVLSNRSGKTRKYKKKNLQSHAQDRYKIYKDEGFSIEFV